MEATRKMMERAACIVVGAAFLSIGLLLVVLGLTLLPVIGVLIGIPVMSLSLFFLKSGLKHEAKQEVEASITWPEEAPGPA